MKILITGASGVLGGNLAFFYRRRYELVGIYNRHFIDMPDVTMVQADLVQESQARYLLDTYDPQVVIHCAAMPHIDQCAANPAQAFAQNVQITRNLVSCLQGRDKKLVFISTDNVYGSRGKHTEEEPLEPVNEYGRTKIMAEQAALSLKGAVVLRTTLFGCGTGSTKTQSEQMILSLLRAEKVRGFDDMFFSPMYVGDFVRIIEQVFQQDLRGVFNAGSSHGASRYDFLRLLALDLRLDVNLIEPISVDSLSLPAARNKNAVMDSNRIAAALKAQMPTIAEGVRHFTDDLKKAVIPPGSVLNQDALHLPFILTKTGL